MIIYVILIFKLWLYGSVATKSQLTFDEFFDYTEFLTLSFSPDAKHLLFQTQIPDWTDNTYKTDFWLYEIKTKTKSLITKNNESFSVGLWSRSGNFIAFLSYGDPIMNQTRNSSTSNNTYAVYSFYLYSVKSKTILPISIGPNKPSTFAWSENDSSIYFVTTKTKDQDKLAWKDVINYRPSLQNGISTIHRLDFSTKQLSKATSHTIQVVPFLISEFLFNPVQQQFIFTSTTPTIENMEDYEVYSINIRNSTRIVQLTNNNLFETQLQLSRDGKRLLFRQHSRSVINNEQFTDVQRRISSLDLATGRIQRIAKDFTGHMFEFISTRTDDVYLLGQVRTEVHIYQQKSPEHNTIDCQGWNGTYHSMAISSDRTPHIAFVYSSLEKPKEIYIVDNIKKLKSARAITNENRIFTQRDLPKTKVYTWKNNQDHQTIEGILHYPPGEFNSKNLPLLVLIHGGPYDANLNAFEANWYNWAMIAAVNGWLVLEPNYCGSTGYGNQFVNDIRFQPLSRPGRDILAAVDSLINEGTADPHRLNVGGYSYGGFLTNWLITQTTRFNAALSGAGAVEQVSSWGSVDLPMLLAYMLGGYPWIIPDIYQNESAIYHLDRVRTATHIVTGEDDIRVHPTQSYMLERALHTLGVPVQLLVFPKEGHEIGINPWHGKIKVREELKWLKKYGHGF